MALFSKTQMSWQEPYFFVVRLREAWGWRNRTIFLVVVAVIMFVAIHFTRGQQFGLGKTIAVSLMCGLVLTALLDYGNIQREVAINEDNIFYHSAVGHSWGGEFKFKDIILVQLTRPEEWKRSYGALLIQTAGDGFLLGVPSKVSLETVANVLHRLGVNVLLTGWEPSETDTRVQVKEEVALPGEGTKPTGTARIWPVDEQEPRLTPPVTTAIALTIGLGPVFLSLVGLIAAGVYLFMKWGVLGGLEKGFIAGGAVAALVASFFYLVVAGQFLAARYQVGVGKATLRNRPNALFNGSEDDLTPVEIFDRAAWTSAIVRSTEFGFLRVDRGARALKLEGEKSRWDIPLSALSTCRIEEAHVGSEGNENAEKRYLVVIALDRNGEPWEAGMIVTRTELGNDGKEARHARAQTLLGRISEAV